MWAPAVIGDTHGVLSESESGAEKPAKPVETPHTSVPRCFTESSVAAAAVQVRAQAASNPAAIAAVLFILGVSRQALIDFSALSTAVPSRSTIMSMFSGVAI